MTEALVVLDEEPRDGGDRAERSGLLRRLLVSGEAGRRGTWALWLGVLGAAAFLASMILDWQTIHVNGVPNDQFVEAVGDQQASAGIGDFSSFGMVFLFGSVGLLAVLGAALSRAEAAARFRFAAVGGAVGLLAVLIAVTVRVVEEPIGFPQTFQLIYGGGALNGPNVRLSVAPGLFAAYLAVALPTVAIWLAGKADVVVPVTRRPPVLERAAEPAPAVAPDVVGPAALPEYQRRNNNQGPLDLTVTPG